MQRKPEDVAAVVNAILVVLLPFVLLALLRLGGGNTSRFIVASGPDSRSHQHFPFSMMLMMSPLALVAGWRTHVYARRRREHGADGWRGVVEAAVFGAAVMLVLWIPAMLLDPRAAFPYMLPSIPAAFAAGLLVGVILRFTALLTLKRVP
jgi:hypothetical protein